MIRWTIYRVIMKVAHHYNWHYMPPCYPDVRDTMYWCHWCGLRDVKRRGDPRGMISK